MTDPAIRELTEAAHCVLAWIDRSVDTGRLAAERLERALATALSHTVPPTDAADEAAIDELMAKRAAGLKTTRSHDVWLAGYRAGQDPNARLGDNPYPEKKEGPNV